MHTMVEIRGVAAALAAAMDVPVIWLFGSYARGDADEDSDLDFFTLVPGDSGASYSAYMRAVPVLSSLASDYRIDLVVSGTDELPGNVLWTHRVLPEGIAMVQWSQHPTEEEARNFLALAQRDIHEAKAIAGSTGEAWRTVGSLCQQGVEKYLKSALAATGTPFPYDHDLLLLSKLVFEAKLLPWSTRGTVDSICGSLAQYEVNSRYDLRISPDGDRGRAFLLYVSEIEDLVMPVIESGFS